MFIDPGSGEAGWPEGGRICSSTGHSLPIPLPIPYPSPPCGLTPSGNPPLQAPSTHISHLNPITLQFNLLVSLLGEEEGECPALVFTAV